MGKKKPFIDKKNASTFHMVRRSQRDVGTEATTEQLSDFVLMPSPDNREETNAKVLSGGRGGGGGVMNQLRQTVADAGLLDEYDYDQHVRPITGSGTFLAAQERQGSVVAQLDDARSRALTLAEDSDVREVSRQLESVALTPGYMDDDVAQALFGDFEKGEFEEIQDDFCLAASQEPMDGEEGAEDEFDFDAHIRGLIEKAQKMSGEAGIPVQQHDWGKKDQDYFGKARPLHKKNIDEEEEDEDEMDSLDREFEQDDAPPGVVSALSPDEERALCEKFEQTLAEYDSDEVGDLDQECDDIRGSRPLEGDDQLEAAFDEFLQEKKDDIFIEGTRNLPHNMQRHGGSGYTALVGKTRVNASDLSGELADQPPPVEEVMAEAKQILANPEMEPPPEDVLIDGKSYFSERTRNPWDCESILTTYSNLDNNPAIIENRSRRRKKKGTSNMSPQHAVPEEQPVQIILSSKTGLPLFPERAKDNDTLASINRGEARSKKESPSEKKARKVVVKQERQVARMQKKMMKDAFNEEFERRSGNVMADNVGGKSVFRYS